MRVSEAYPLELQDRFPPIAIPLSEVGVVGVRVPLSFENYEGRKIVVVPQFDAFVDLPAWRKGIHASRQYETIIEVFSQFAGKAYKLEKVCAKMALEILRRQEEASRARVRAVGEAVLEKLTPVTRRVSFEPYRLLASALAVKDPANGRVKIVSKVGVGVRGVTACPCAQELIGEHAKGRLLKAGISEAEARRVIEVIPVATHMQRSLGMLITEVPEGFHIDAFKLAEIVEESMSSPSYGLLKREDEVEIVVKAAERALFAEDVVRIMMKKFVEAFPDLPDSTKVWFKVKSEESIHKHNLVAKKAATFGVLKAEVEANSQHGSR
ncbi:GTP cyclohydrolase I FolE2 [Candidatus Bathyarchaeota archaeon]|nr:MAG: GTP cyclohydrolase I FolE2 [Candidatus Bathyarchaeota archaeon]